MTRKDLCIIVIPLNKGTLARRAFDLAEALSELRIEVKIFILYNRRFSDFEFKDVAYGVSSGIKIIDYFLNILKLSFLKFRFLPSFTLSVVDSCSIVNVMALGPGRRYGQFRAPIEQLIIWNNRAIWTKISYNLFFKRLDKFLCVSKQVKDSIIVNIPNIPIRKLEVLYNYYDKKQIIAKSWHELSYDFSSWSNDYIILNVGRVEKIKCQERILKSISLLSPELKRKIRLVVIGEANSEYIKELNKINTYEFRVEYMGNVLNPYPFYKNADLFILSSVQEGLPGSLIEALFLGLPSIATNCSQGVWEIFDVASEYRSDLSIMHPVGAGYIIPNNMELMVDKDVVSEDVVIDQMAKAIGASIEREVESFNFHCVNKFTDKSIFNNFLN